MSRRRQWVPPPNWPRPPYAGWEPSGDWKPDPAWGPAPEWWNFYPVSRRSPLAGHGRLIAVVAGVVIGLAVIAGIAVALAGGSSPEPKIDPIVLDQQIENHYRGLGLAVTVTCPSGEPTKARTTFLCPLVNAKPFHFIQVTVLNGAGDVNFKAEE